MERIFVARKGGLRKTTHATVTKGKDFLESCVAQGSTHPNEKSGFPPLQPSQTLIKTVSRALVFPKVKPFLFLHLFLHHHLPYPITNVPFKIPQAKKGRAALKGNTTSLWGNGATCSLSALPVPASNLPHIST